jgi:hypothetical protein
MQELSVSNEPEFNSYVDDALVDMKELQRRQWKLEDEDRKAAALAISRKNDLKVRRIQMVRDVWYDFVRPVLVTALIIGAVVVLIFFIHKWNAKDEVKDKASDAIWNSGCIGAGGVLALNDTTTNTDNLCTFKNGLTAESYTGDRPRNRIKDHTVWSQMCAEAGGTATTKDYYSDKSNCIFPNGFSVPNTES